MHIVSTCVRALPVSLLATGVVAAQEDDEEGGGEAGLAEALLESIEGWDEVLKELLVGVFFTPFQVLAEAIVGTVVTVLTTTPAVYPNPAVEELHRQTLILAFLLATLALMVAGILYMIGPVLGVSYAEVRLILPRVFLALVFGSVSLPLLQLTIDFTDALVHAFEPSRFELSFTEMLGLGTGVIIAVVVQSVLLLAVAALMIIRMVYIMFVAAISPLLALMWSLPRTRRYADTFISGYYAALIIAPLNLLVLRFSLALLDGNGTTVLQSTSNWILGIASLTLLILVPRQVWGASQIIVGQASRAAVNTISRFQNRGEEEDNFDLSEDEQRRLQSYRRRKEMEESDQ